MTFACVFTLRESKTQVCIHVNPRKKSRMSSKWCVKWSRAHETGGTEAAKTVFLISVRFSGGVLTSSPFVLTQFVPLCFLFREHQTRATDPLLSPPLPRSETDLLRGVNFWPPPQLIIFIVPIPHCLWLCSLIIAKRDLERWESCRGTHTHTSKKLWEECGHLLFVLSSSTSTYLLNHKGLAWEWGRMDAALCNRCLRGVLWIDCVCTSEFYYEGRKNRMQEATI